MTHAKAGQPRYFDDVVVGQELLSQSFMLERDAIIAFATAWDPLPVHLNDCSAQMAGFSGITASGTHLLAIKHKLLYDFGFAQTVIASFGLDEVRYLEPGRPGDLVHVRLRWVEKRESRSRPGQGIVRHFNELLRQDGKPLISLYDTIIMRCRP